MFILLIIKFKEYKVVIVDYSNAIIFALSSRTFIIIVMKLKDNW